MLFYFILFKFIKYFERKIKLIGFINKIVFVIDYPRYKNT